MAEYIDRDALLAEAKRISGPMTGDGWDNWGVYALINRQPAADVVEVVRCKDWINIVDKTEQWSKEHPVMTNAQKFKEVFGFLPDGDVIFSKGYFINAVKGPVLKWDEPYEENKE